MKRFGKKCLKTEFGNSLEKLTVGEFWEYRKT
jgi:hypothetical protein